MSTGHRLKSDSKQLKILALIPARGGSKGIPLKNIADLGGKPLLYYSWQIAKECEYIDDVIISTDSERIISVCNAFKIPTLKRPEKFASDLAKMDGVIEHTLENSGSEYDLLVLLQPTSPLRSLKTLNRAIEEFAANMDEYDSLIPLKEIEPKIGRIENGQYRPLFDFNKQRQELGKLYAECGTIFIYNIDSIKNARMYQRKYPFIISNFAETIDIDIDADLKLAERFLEK